MKLFSNVLNENNPKNIKKQSLDTITSYYSNSPSLERWIQSLPNSFKEIELNRCDKLPKELVSYGLQWPISWPPISLYLFGIAGSGKSSFGVSLIKHAFRVLEGQGYFWANLVNGSNLSAELLDAIRSGNESWVLDKYIESPLIFIDDIDKISPSDRITKQIYTIINGRYERELPTLISGNSEPDQLMQIFESATISRMSDTEKWAMIPFPSKDLRQMKRLLF